MLWNLISVMFRRLSYARNTFSFETKTEKKPIRPSCDQWHWFPIVDMNHEVDIFMIMWRLFYCLFSIVCFFLYIFSLSSLCIFFLFLEGFTDRSMRLRSIYCQTNHKFRPNKVAIECVDRKANKQKFEQEKKTHTTYKIKRSRQNKEWEYTNLFSKHAITTTNLKEKKI